jgi:hypothetical protein
MPATARSVGVTNVHDPHQAYAGAAKLMRQYLDAYHGDWKKALTAYNAGPGAVGGSLPAETRNYISTIVGGGSGKQSMDSSSPLSFIPDKLKLSTSTSFDQAAFDAAKRKQIVAKLLSSNHSGGVLFRTGVLSTAAPNPADFTTSVLKSSIDRGGLTGGGGDAGTSAKGVATFEGKKVAAWIKPWLVKARRAGWKGTVTSGYRSFAEQTRIYNSGVRPAAKPGTSNHEGTDFPRGAVDVSDAEQLAQILRRLKAPLQWAGSKDPVHFSHPHGGSY